MRIVPKIHRWLHCIEVDEKKKAKCSTCAEDAVTEDGN